MTKTEYYLIRAAISFPAIMFYLFWFMVGIFWTCGVDLIGNRGPAWAGFWWTYSLVVCFSLFYIATGTYKKQRDKLRDYYHQQQGPQ